MQILGWIIKLLPFLFQLMKIAEQDLGAGTGPDKKQFVVDGLKVGLSAVTELSEGGQKETWQILEKPISGLIDAGSRLIPPQALESNR